MKTTNICTKETDLEIVYGMINYVDTPREAAFSSVKYLFSDLTDIRKYYIRLGFHLEEFSRNSYYLDFGFSTLEDFCEKNLGLDKSAVSRCINVYRNFNASSSVVFKNGVEIRGSAMELAEEWKDFSYTQLCEMLPLSEEQRKEIKPDMSVKQIREYKKDIRSQKEAASDKPVASTQRKMFNYKLYDNSVGIVRQNAVRNCDAINENAVFNVFDKNGKFLYGNVLCDLIYAQNGTYFFRLWQSDDKGHS